jgi:hypothetical protein
MTTINRTALAILPALLSTMSLGQTITGLIPTGEGATSNQAFLANRGSNPKLGSRSVSKESTGPQRNVIVFIGDRIIPQFVDGGSWLTAITLVNLENHSTNFDLLFFNDNGTDFNVSVVGQGVVRGMNITLNTAGSFTFQTAGTDRNTSAGWALLSQTTSDSVGMFAIFRQNNFGGQAQEAVVPSVNQFAKHFVLPFDNTGSFSTGIAISNPTVNSVVIPVSIRNELGQIIDTRSISLGGYSHTSFPLPVVWASTAGIRGAIEFLTSGFGVGALGLRFNGSAFTSLNVLENYAWTQ